MPNLSELLYYNGETSMQLITWSFFIGVVIATVAGYFIKTKFGAFIRTLLDKEIDSPEKACTLEELGLNKKLFIKYGLRSHANYKNMLVAITEDGKFYANNEYTDAEPLLKEFIVVKRKRGSDVIKETKSDDDRIPLSGLAKVLQSKEKLAAEKTAEVNDTKTTDASCNTEASENAETSGAPNTPRTERAYAYTDIPKQRVKFDVTKARYYIPPEIHDRAYSLYHSKSGKSNGLVVAIVLLIILAAIATFSGNLISGFTDMLSGIENPFKKPII